MLGFAALSELPLSTLPAVVIAVVVATVVAAGGGGPDDGDDARFDDVMWASMREQILVEEDLIMQVLMRAVLEFK